MKTVFLNRVLATLFICCLFIFTSCSKDEDLPVDPPISGEDATAFNAAMAQLGAFDQPAETTIAEDGDAIVEKENELECTTRTFKGAPGYNEMFTLDPTTDVIYPGALLKGESIPLGTYEGISADRAPITISVSLQNIKNVKITIDNPDKLSNVRQGITDLLDQEVNGATAAQATLDISEVYSEQHLEAAIGVNYRGVGKKVSGSVDFSSSTYKNTFVLKFIQKYYTLDVDNPGASPSALFTKAPSISNFGSTSPVYVSSVLYGRMVLYTVETNSSLTEVRTAFEASVGSVDGSIDAEYQNTINSSNIKALIIGGSGSGAVQAINGPSEVYKFIAEGGNYSKDSPGAPLAYSLRFVKQGFPAAKVVLATEYQIRECDLAYPEFTASIVKITGTQPTDTEVYGKLRIKMWVGGKRLDANGNGLDDGETWSVAKADAVDVQNGKTYVMDDEYTYTFKPYRPNMVVDFLEYSGELRDSNGILGSTSIGDKYEEFKLEDVGIGEEEELTLDFSDGITAHFKITRIR